MGWNAIRLGVVWAGAQPQDEDALDPDFLQRLHAVLNLTDRTGIHVMLDNHGDMTGTAGCGNGAPMWFQQKAAPELIGKPLETGFPFSLVPGINIKDLHGYDYCGDNATMWAQFAGDPNYNLLNPCCQQMNSPNPGALGYTTIAQKVQIYFYLDVCDGDLAIFLSIQQLFGFCCLSLSRVDDGLHVVTRAGKG